MIKANTRDVSKGAYFICADCISGKILFSQYDQGLNNVKAFKDFIIHACASLIKIRGFIFIPNMARSALLNTLNINSRGVVYYINSSLEQHKLVLNSIRDYLLSDEKPRNAISLESLIHQYNIRCKVYGKSKVKPISGIRKYSTSSSNHCKDGNENNNPPALEGTFERDVNVYNSFTGPYRQNIMTILSPRPKSSKDFKYDFMTYDTETYPGPDNKAVPYIFGLYSKAIGYKQFTGEDCVEKALSFILNTDYGKKKRIVLYAHNAGKFDNFFLINSLTGFKNIGINTMVDAFNSVFYMKLTYNKVTFEFRDSYKIMPLTLDKLIKDLGVSVKNFNSKLPFDHNWVTRDRLEYKGKLPA